MNALAPTQEVLAPVQDYPSERACTKCGVVKPLDEFGRHKRGRYGRRAYCLSCQAAQAREWRTRTSRVDYFRRWRKLNAEKWNAHLQVKAAIEDGRLRGLSASR